MIIISNNNNNNKEEEEGEEKKKQQLTSSSSIVLSALHELTYLILITTLVKDPIVINVIQEKTMRHIEIE